MRNNLYPAVQGVGKTVLVVKGNQVIGKAYVCGALGDQFVSVTFKEGEILALTERLEAVQVLGHRHAMFRYLPMTGTFFGSAFLDDQEATEDVLGETAIVDEFNFRYGLAPERFAEVPGYRQALEDAAPKAA